MTGVQTCALPISVNVSLVPLSSDPFGDDDVICVGGSTQLHANVMAGDCNGYTVSTVAYAPIAGSGTNVTLSDDAVSSALNVGFDFVFFCNFYDQFYISSNGFMTFN